MIDIYKEEKHTLHFIFGLYVIYYSIDDINQDRFYITYYVPIIYENKTKLNECEILFDKETKKIIRRFLRIPIKKIINDSLNEENRLCLTHIKKRSELEIIISFVKRELRRIINGYV